MDLYNALIFGDEHPEEGYTYEAASFAAAASWALDLARGDNEAILEVSRVDYRCDRTTKTGLR